MSKVEILIVEDERIVAAALQELLKHMGYSVAGVTDSGEGAVQMAEETRPDLVLMDIRLRGNMDGIEAAAEIDAQLEIPIVYLTAYADEGMIRRAEATKHYGYIVKPFRMAELRVAIEAALESREKERNSKKQADPRGDWVQQTLC